MRRILPGIKLRSLLVLVLYWPTGCGGPGDDPNGAGDGTDPGVESDANLDTSGDSEKESDPGYDHDTSTAIDTEPVAGDAPTISGLSVEANPNSVVSCFVIWTTDVPADSEVQFGSEAYGFRIRRVNAVTAHRVLVIGMRAETAYQIRAISTTAGGTASADTTWMTGSLPDIVPLPQLTVNDTASSQAGWTLTNVSAGTRPVPPAVIAMYDQEGYPVWYYIRGDESDDRGDIDARLLDSGNVLVGATSTLPPVEVDLAGNVVWEGPSQVGNETPMTHHIDKLDNGNYVTLREVPSENKELNGTMIEELTPDLDVVWQWNILDHVEAKLGADFDWCHGNSVTIDSDNDVFYMSCRNLHTVFKGRISSGELLWRLGKEGDFDIEPPTDDAWFAELHEPEIQSNGNILLYDNGSVTRPNTRVVEYALDEDRMTATLVWEFPGDFTDLSSWYTTSWYTPLWGDADRLANGNTLIVAGTRSSGDQSRIFEVTNEGRVVWDILFPLKDGAGLGIYRAERLSPPPLVEPL